MMYRFVTLDLRRGPESAKANEAIFALAPVYGVKVIIPALAERCVTNLDPQHTGSDASRAAIEDALEAPLPPVHTTLATIRADLDSVGSMAVFHLRILGISLESALDRVAAVVASDKFNNGEWAPRPFPAMEEPWSAEESGLATIAAAVMDFKVSLEQRVFWMEEWLRTAEEPDGYRAKVEKEHIAFISALENGEIAHWVVSNGRIAVVESTHRAVTSVGYALAPVVVAINLPFRLCGGEPHVKFTVYQFSGGSVNLMEALAELNELEPGWGGSPTIVGSPQGVSSTLTTDEVVAVVERHLT